MGPDALDWHNWFGPSKNLDKTCLFWIFNLSSMWARRHGKIFVGHNCQSHGLINNIACALFAGKVTCVSRVMGSWWSLTSSIERVALAYYCLCSSFFLFLQFVQLQQRQLPLLLCHWRLHHVRLQLVLDYHHRFVLRRRRTPRPYYWNLAFSALKFIFTGVTSPKNSFIARCECRAKRLTLIILAGFGLKYSDLT